MSYLSLFQIFFFFFFLGATIKLRYLWFPNFILLYVEDVDMCLSLVSAQLNGAFVWRVYSEPDVVLAVGDGQ